MIWAEGWVMGRGPVAASPGTIAMGRHLLVTDRDPIPARISPRPGRIRAGRAASPLAGPREDRRPVRPELRGGRGELRPAWGRSVGDIPVGDRRPGPIPGRAPHEHGIPL